MCPDGYLNQLIQISWIVQQLAMPAQWEKGEFLNEVGVTLVFPPDVLMGKWLAFSLVLGLSKRVG